ncbi:UPF0598 protein CG30010 [Lycorma delicatula]|uniref:UPF0598 protein CG30010 n=1 Tax=Lycorma delicatula TaxID=130591 RepID=UPI003F512495
MIPWKYTKPFVSRILRISYKNDIAYVSYVQGQSPEPKVREYFYYIDHQGMLFLDDAKMKNFTSCFKEKKFLTFFFKRIKPNDTGRYEAEFPYVSLCGRERNYVRCDDQPIVFTQLVKNPEGKDLLNYGYAGDALSVEFLPDKLCMVPKTGRVYHPAPEKIHPVGLVQSKLAIELSQYFKFDNGEHQCPTHFVWNNITYTTDNNWYTSFLS